MAEGRNFIGMEKEEKYFQIAKNRIENVRNVIYGGDLHE